MTRMVVARIEDMVKGQAIMSIKFYDSKYQVMVQWQNNLLEGGGISD